MIELHQIVLPHHLLWNNRATHTIKCGGQMLALTTSTTKIESDSLYISYSAKYYIAL